MERGCQHSGPRSKVYGLRSKVYGLSSSLSPRALHRHVCKKLAVRALKGLIGRERPDIVHVKGRIVTEALAALPAERTLYQHALMGTVDSSWTEPELAAFRPFLNRVAAVLVQGRAIAETFSRSFGIERPVDVVFSMAPDELPPDMAVRLRAEGIRNEADLARQDGRSLHFGIVARLTDQKGIRFILDALKQYRDRLGDVHFTFAGQGPWEKRIEAFAREHGLRHVRVIPLTDLVATLVDLDVFVHPGLDDAMPVSIVEALMCGVPCIGSRVGATPELVRDGQEGIMVDPGSTDGILQAMLYFAGLSPDERAAYRRRARLRYESCCTPEIVGEQVERVYRRIAAGCRETRADSAPGPATMDRL